jgi:hypothetical protein
MVRPAPKFPPKEPSASESESYDGSDEIDNEGVLFSDSEDEDEEEERKRLEAEKRERKRRALAKRKKKEGKLRSLSDSCI